MSFLKNLLMNLMGGNKWSHGGGHYSGGHGSRSKHGYDSYGSNSHSGSSSAEVICFRCNQPNSSVAKYCQGCGASLMQSACTGCGTTLALGAKFCGQCGKQS